MRERTADARPRARTERARCGDHAALRRPRRNRRHRTRRRRDARDRARGPAHQPVLRDHRSPGPAPPAGRADLCRERRTVRIHRPNDGRSTQRHEPHRRGLRPLRHRPGRRDGRARGVETLAATPARIARTDATGNRGSIARLYAPVRSTRIVLPGCTTNCGPGALRRPSNEPAAPRASSLRVGGSALAGWTTEGRPALFPQVAPSRLRAARKPNTGARWLLRSPRRAIAAPPPPSASRRSRARRAHRCARSNRCRASGSCRARSACPAAIRRRAPAARRAGPAIR